MKLFKTITILIATICLLNHSKASDYCNTLPQLIYHQITPIQSDSLIKDNASNPNFAILDVRTPDEYNPQHLQGAINRNYYDSDFSDQLTALDKNKTYLIHCKSGGRSGNAFNTMKTLGFREVYNMAGGINSWNSSLLPTTSDFASKLGIYMCNVDDIDTISIGLTDTLFLKVTNSANDILQINSIVTTGSGNFQLDFKNSLSLNGAENIQIPLIYTPLTNTTDSINLAIESNAGNMDLTIIRYGSSISHSISNETKEILFYPNPAKDRLYFKKVSHKSSVDVKIYSLTGRMVLEKARFRSTQLDIQNLKSGIYLMHVRSGNKISTSKLVVSK